MSKKPLRIGLAGLGTVGGGLIALIDGADATLAGQVEIVGVTANSRSRDRGFDISKYRWFDDAAALATDPEVDVYVELMGGSDGAAKHSVEAALKAGKNVVTANKALLAEHGLALAALAELQGRQLRYEAAVAGGIPIIKALREGLSANRITGIAGILNGTCNYILTTMESTGRTFGDVLAEAQRFGYAEADPTLDVSGADAAHKVSILAALAFGGAPNYAGVQTQGIQEIQPIDLEAARGLGRRIRLVARAVLVDGAVEQTVRPLLLPADHPIARAEGPLNAVVVDGVPIGRLTLVGRGAGAGPTASAVAADLIDLIHGDERPVFAAPVAGNAGPKAAAPGTGRSRFYVRLRVADRPGVIAAITETLARHEVSIESFMQRPIESAAQVPIILTTQTCDEAIIARALSEIASLPAVVEAPCLLRLED